MTFGDWLPERLREAREAMRESGRPVSQERFAELIGVSDRSVLRWETHGDAEPRRDYARRIASVTGRPLSFFYTPTVAETPVLSLDEALILRVREEVRRQLADHFRKETAA